MTNQITNKSIAKNITLSIVVQVISVIVGFVMNLIVPKFIDEYQYSYWQTFLLYTQYIGILHFGLLDGIVLRYSQYDYNELDKKIVRSQYRVIISIDAIVAVGMLAVAFLFLSGFNRVLCILLAFVMLAEITYNYVSFTFQITNRIGKYALYIIVYRCVYCCLVLLCLVFKFEQYYWYCIVYIAADVIGIVAIGMKYSRELFFGKLLAVSDLISELKTTLSAGIWLMIASYSANLVIGFGKMIVQWHWDTLTFGKISLAYSLTNFVLQFVTAISVVLFPSLKRIDPQKLPAMYMTIRNSISPLLIFALICYYPGSFVLDLWLPKYAASLVYLGILMPIIVYTSKVSLLTNNYLKAYRKERVLLVINIATVVFSLVTFLFIAYVVNNLNALLIAVVGAIMIRSIVSEIVVMRIIEIRMVGDFILEFAMTAVFIISTVCFDRWIGCAIYSVAIVVYFIIKRDSIIQLLKQIKRILLKHVSK